ncbi:MAG: phage tail protein [Bacteroidales bacterium]|nr:phage tail protein [Bacteroidales bacterium]
MLATLLLSGCGQPEPDPMTTVHGTVTFQGQPLAGGLIVFSPDRERSTATRTLAAEIGGDGQYFLITDGLSNVPPGWYHIAIADTADLYTSAENTVRFPAALRRSDCSHLEREIIAGHDHVFDFHVQVAD